MHWLTEEIKLGLFVLLKETDTQFYIHHWILTQNGLRLLNEMFMLYHISVLVMWPTCESEHDQDIIEAAEEDEGCLLEVIENPNIPESDLVIKLLLSYLG